MAPPEHPQEPPSRGREGRHDRRGEARVKLLEAQVEQEYDADEQIERANTADRQGIGSA